MKLSILVPVWVLILPANYNPQSHIFFSKVLLARNRVSPPGNYLLQDLSNSPPLPRHYFFSDHPLSNFGTESFALQQALAAPQQKGDDTVYYTSTLFKYTINLILVFVKF